MRIVPPPSAVIDWENPINRGLIDCYITNEGGGLTLHDFGTNKNDATIQNLDHWAHGRLGRSLKGDGAGRPATATGHELNPFSYEVLWQAVSTASQGILGMTESPGSGVSDRNIETHSDGRFRFHIYDGSAEYAYSTTTAEAGGIYHIVGTSDGSNIRIYINGVLEDTEAAGDAYTGYSSPILLIGESGLSSGTPGDGYVYLVRNYNRVLGADEIRQQANDPWRTWDYPRIRRGSYKAPAAPPAGISIPVAMHHYSKNLRCK